MFSNRQQENRMHKIVTLNDAVKAKRAKDAIAAAIEADKARVRYNQLLTLAQNMHIGELMRQGNPVFYTFRDGNYIESANINDLV
jgi:hypothetical protein